MKKKLPIGIVLIFLVSLFLAANVFAADSEGKCGDNLTYTISPDGSTLKIEGTGDMWNFQEYSDSPEPGVIVYWTSAPWGGIDDIGKLTTIEIGDDVTSIGAFAFDACYNVTEIKIGSGLKTFTCVVLLQRVASDSHLLANDIDSLCGVFFRALLCIPLDESGA